MYKIYCDDLLLYHPLDENYAILNGNATLEVNKAGSLSFTIPENNARYGYPKLMKSIIKLYDDNRLIFRGRPYAPNRNLYRDNEIICEGELAFFNDSIQPPFSHSGTVASLFTTVIETHNSQVDEEKRFKVGNITVVNSTETGNIVRSDTEYLTTWEILKTKFFESELGGYLWVRHEDDGVYIDYLDDLPRSGDQTVEQAVNLMDVTESVSGDTMATAVIPLGAKTEDVYTTITAVNNGVNYLYDETAVEEYGWIFKTVIHEDIHDPGILLSAGRKDLADAVGVTTTIEVTASDLAKAGYNVEPFSFGTYIRVKIDKLNVDRKMLINKLSFDLLRPESIIITIGDEFKSFSNHFGTAIEAMGTLITNTNTRLDNIAEKKGITSSEVLYYLSTSNTSQTGGSWVTKPPTWVDGHYYWQKIVTTYTDGSTSESIPVCITGGKGDTGDNGVGIKSVTNYYLATASVSGITAGTSGWTTTIQTITPEKKYLWNYEVITYTNDSTSTTSPCIIGVYGNKGLDGVSITSVDVQYYLSTSSTALSGGSWSTTAPAWVNGKYMWSKTVTTYSDNTSSESDPVCITGAKGSGGDNGVGVSSIVEQYYHSTSASALSGGSWGTSVPTWVDGKYIWTRSIITYTNGNTTTTTAVCVTGGKGATGATGNGIESVVNYYLATASASGVTTSTSGWTTSVQSVTDTKKYLWNYEVITYTDKSTKVTDPCIIGVYGDKGNAGNGISSITEHYQVSTSNSTAPTSWVTTVPTLTATNKYLWNYETITYTDGTSKDTAKRVIGVYGDKGSTGNGISKVTEYYAVSTSNTTTPTSWSETVPTLTTTNKYLWSYEKITYTDGSTSDSAKRVIGVYGNTGSTGTGISSVTTQFYLSTSKTTQTGGSWVETMPTWSKNMYLWTRSKIVYTNPSSTVYTTPICDSSWEAVNEVVPDIEEASKVATNYIDFNNGLVIGDMTTGSLGKNIFIDADSIDVRNGQTVLASFQANQILLGKNNKSATIELCGGLGEIYNLGGDDNWNRLVMHSEDALIYSTSGLIQHRVAYSPDYGVTEMGASFDMVTHAPWDSSYTEEALPSIGLRTYHTGRGKVSAITLTTGSIAITADTILYTGTSRFTSAPYINNMKMAPVCSGNVDPGSVPKNSYVDVSVTFPFTFSSTPNVVATLVSTSTASGLGGLLVAVYSRSTTGATFRIFNNTDTGRSPDIMWIATQN